MRFPASRQVLEISRQGLKARAYLDDLGSDETQFLSSLERIVETGKTSAEDLLDKFHGPWGGDIEHIYRECAF